MNAHPPEAQPWAIHVQGLNKSFGRKPVVRDVTISVRQGSITGFLGPNGAGKTTCLRLLCGLLTADSGEGTVLGYDFRTQSGHIKRLTGYMTQSFSLYTDLTVYENILFMARVYGLTQQKERVQASLEQFGLTARQHDLAGTLSGGWKQRVALAVSVLHEPKLLLLDEPTAGVDPMARRDFWDTLHDLAAGGLTVLVSTHYMDEAERCHDIAYIVNGQIMAQGKPNDLVRQSGLITFEVTGDDLAALGHALSKEKAVVSAGFFGDRLHVSGMDRAELVAVLSRYKDTVTWRESASTLEDIFIMLMQKKAS